MMINPDSEDAKLAARLNVSLMFPDYPVTIVRLCTLIAELQERLDAVERKRR